MNWQFQTRLNENHRSLRGDPAYDALIGKIEADIARQLQNGLPESG